MARTYVIDWSTREECLEALAETFGRRAPVEPPEWWKQFEAWYLEQRENADGDGLVELEVKTKSERYEDDQKDEEEEEEEDDDAEDDEDDEEPEDDDGLE